MSGSPHSPGAQARERGEAFDPRRVNAALASEPGLPPVLPSPLTAGQEHALRRFLGIRPTTRVVMAVPRAHFVAMPGGQALELNASLTLPDGRTVRYVLHGQTVFVADVMGTAGPAAG